MKRSRAIGFLVCLGLAPAAFGCAQIAGLTDDYKLGSAGMGESAGMGGRTGSSGNGGASGRLGASGDAGTGEDAGSGGDAGSGEAGANTKGGTSGTGGTVGTSGTAGTGGGVGGSSGGTGGAAGNGLAGSGGGTVVGPTRIGFSQFHDSAAGNDNASSHLANATFSKPKGTSAGDLILVFFGSDHSLSNLDGTTLSNLGWTLLDQHADYGTDGQGAYLLYKFAGSNEPDPIVFNDINPAGGGDGVQGLLSVYRGVNAIDPVNAYEVAVVKSGAVETQVMTATPAITTTVDNCLLIAGLSPDTTVDRPVINSWPQGFDENQMSVQNPPNPYPLGWANIFSAERHLATAGTVPASSFNWTVTDGGQYYGSLSFVLALSP